MQRQVDGDSERGEIGGTIGGTDGERDSQGEEEVGVVGMAQVVGVQRSGVAEGCCARLCGILD